MRIADIDRRRGQLGQVLRSLDQPRVAATKFANFRPLGDQRVIATVAANPIDSGPADHDVIAIAATQKVIGRSIVTFAQDRWFDRQFVLGRAGRHRSPARHTNEVLAGRQVPHVELAEVIGNQTTFAIDQSSDHTGRSGQEQTIGRTWRLNRRFTLIDRHRHDDRSITLLKQTAKRFDVARQVERLLRLSLAKAHRPRENNRLIILGARDPAVVATTGEVQRDRHVAATAGSATWRDRSRTGNGSITGPQLGPRRTVRSRAGQKKSTVHLGH